MRRHEREPVNYTCKSIENTMDVITTINEGIKKFDTRNFEKSVEILKHLNRRLVEDLEKIRQDNESLRSWGVEEAEVVDRLMEEIKELKNKY